MREILFRGYNTAFKKWCYGNLIVCDNGEHIITDDYVSVKRETVGQYTGLTDINGIKIFEGDIVKYGRYKAVVEFSSKHNLGANGFEYDYNICGFFAGNEFITDEMIEGNVEVIGNIYDNPELLKGVQE